MKKNKKAQGMDVLAGLAIGIVTLMITLTVAFLIMDEGKSAITDNVAVTTITNESVVFANSTYTRFATTPFANEHYGFVCHSVVNSTISADAVEILSGNWSCDWNGINITMRSSESTYAMAVGTSYNVSYSYKARTLGYNGTGELQNATQDIPGWIPIIVIVVIGSVLLGLIALFRRR